MSKWLGFADDLTTDGVVGPPPPRFSRALAALLTVILSVIGLVTFIGMDPADAKNFCRNYLSAAACLDTDPSAGLAPGRATPNQGMSAVAAPSPLHEPSPLPNLHVGAKSGSPKSARDRSPPIAAPTDPASDTDINLEHYRDIEKSL